LGIANNQVVTLTTDSEGLAEMRKKSGAMVHARATAEGYAEYRDQKSARNLDLSRVNINYSISNKEYDGVPTATNPTILRLRKKLPDAQLIRFRSKRVGIGRNGEETSITAKLHGGEKAITMKVKCWSEAPSPFTYDQYDWKAEIRVKNGQILRAQNEHGFEAPVQGYSDKLIIDMQGVEDLNWERIYGGRKAYCWLKLDNGKYAKVNYQVQTGRDHEFKFEGYLNMDETRALDVQF